MLGLADATSPVQQGSTQHGASGRDGYDAQAVPESQEWQSAFRAMKRVNPCAKRARCQSHRCSGQSQPGRRGLAHEGDPGNEKWCRQRRDEERA